MKRLAFLVGGLFILPLAGGQFYGLALRIDGSSLSSNNLTTYTLRIRNATDISVENLCIRRAGIDLHHETFRPAFRIPVIKPNGTYTLKIRIRGEVSPPPEPERIGFEGVYYQGRLKYNVFLPELKTPDGR